MSANRSPVPPIINHDPDEPPPDRSKSPWGILAILLTVGWAGGLFLLDIDWTSVIMGAATAGVFVSWAVDITGNRVPSSWRKPPGAGR